MTFTFDFLQSYVAISANFVRIDKNLVPINQGKSILFEYQHLLAAYPLHSLCFFHEIYPLDDLDIYCGILRIPWSYLETILGLLY